jgi:DNA mismatch repair protein MutS
MTPAVVIDDWNDDIVFLRRVIPGPAERSFGIQVARLAGLPPSVIDRARAILAKLEGDETAVELPSSPVAKPKKKLTVAPADTAQLELL